MFSIHDLNRYRKQAQQGFEFVDKEHYLSLLDEIERQRALIKDAEYIFLLQLGYFNNENENHKDREYIDYLLGLGRYFNSNE